MISLKEKRERELRQKDPYMVTVLWMNTTIDHVPRKISAACSPSNYNEIHVSSLSSKILEKCHIVLLAM